MPRFSSGRRYKRKYRQARRGWRKGYNAIKLMAGDDRMRLFGPTYMQRLQRPSLPEQTPQQRWMRRAMNYRGEGDYWSGIRDWGKRWVPEGTFSAAGGFLGGAYGGAAGAEVGGNIGSRVAKWAGFGDYGPAVTNQIMGGGPGSGMTVNASDDLTGDVYLSHKEFVNNVTCSGVAGASTGFQQVTYALNPGIQTTFPFLSQLASNFEMYDFQGLIFEYRPTMGENANINTNALGKVMMATNYDPDAPAWLNSIQLQNYDYATSGKPSAGMIHGIETANKQQAVNMMYVRTNNDTSKNKLFTDLGTFTMATEGIPLPAGATNQIIGELWVTYRIKLSRAALFNSLLGLSQPLDTFRAISSASSMMPTTAIVRRATNAGIWNIAGAGTSTITLTADARLSAGCYQIVFQQVEDLPATTVTNITLTNFVNCSAINQVGAATLLALPEIVSRKTAAESNATLSAFIKISNTNGIAPSFRLTFTGTQAGVAGLLNTITISQVPCTIDTDPLI